MLLRAPGHPPMMLQRATAPGASRGLFGTPRPQVILRRHLAAHKARGRQLSCRASAEAAALLTAGCTKYEAGDRMAALGYFENSLKQSPTKDDRLAALWNSMCVHAYFGDAEVAQIPLREAIANGLDFESTLVQSLQGTDPRLVKLQTSAQVQIQLRRFAAKAQAAAKAGEAQPPPAYASKAPRATGRGQGYLQQDVSEMTKTEMTGLDTSMLGVVRRVALLLLALIALGVILFYGGLQYTFPEQ